MIGQVHRHFTNTNVSSRPPLDTLPDRVSGRMGTTLAVLAASSVSTRKLPRCAPVSSVGPVWWYNDLTDGPTVPLLLGNRSSVSPLQVTGIAHKMPSEIGTVYNVINTYSRSSAMGGVRNVVSNSGHSADFL